MKTTKFVSKEEADKNLDWVCVDAQDIVLGRVASKIATVLRGKHSPKYTPHVKSGPGVIVVNASKVKLTGKKATDKFYYHHTGFPGGIKKVSAGALLEKDPGRLITLAVKKMLPSGRLSHQLMTRLRVFSGPEHNHSAQQPQQIEVN